MQDSCTLVTNSYDFKHRVIVKKIIIEFIDSVAAGATGCEVYLMDQNGTGSVMSAINTKSTATNEITIFPVARTPVSTFLQFTVQPKDNKGIRRFIVSYDTVD